MHIENYIRRNYCWIYSMNQSQEIIWHLNKIFMTKMTVTIILLLNTLFVSGQSRTMMVYDLALNSVDSIIVDLSTIDNSIEFDHSAYNIGDFNEDVEILEQETPTENFEDAFNNRFTKRLKANLDFELNSFPLRTSVKISEIIDETTENLCSGSMISRRHILSAAHCYQNKNEDTLRISSLNACPIFDEGQSNQNFGCINVSKIYLFKNWDLNSTDFAILELNEDIGNETGWIGLGFDNRNEVIEEHIYYKFAYPSQFYDTDAIQYNGDTLYYRYGNADIIDFLEPYTFIGTSNSAARQGESGSSMIRIDNNEVYATYGVLTYGPNSMHNRITNEIYHSINYIIKDHVSSTKEIKAEAEFVVVYPNPTDGHFHINNLYNKEITSLKVFDTLGNKLISHDHIDASNNIDISHLPNGQYFLKIISENSSISKIITKSQ